MTEAFANRQDELLTGVHPPPNDVAVPRAHPGVPVHVVGVWATPGGDEVVLSLERRLGRVPVADRPLQPAEQLLGEMEERLASNGEVVREVLGGRHPVSEVVETGYELLPRLGVAHAGRLRGE